MLPESLKTSAVSLQEFLSAAEIRNGHGVRREVGTGWFPDETPVPDRTFAAQRRYEQDKAEGRFDDEGADPYEEEL